MLSRAEEKSDLEGVYILLWPWNYIPEIAVTSYLLKCNLSNLTFREHKNFSIVQAIIYTQTSYNSPNGERLMKCVFRLESSTKTRRDFLTLSIRQDLESSKNNQQRNGESKTVNMILFITNWTHLFQHIFSRCSAC